MAPFPTPVQVAPSMFSADRDCRDFKTRWEAQRFLRGDPRPLDDDSGGLACAFKSWFDPFGLVWKGLSSAFELSHGCGRGTFTCSARLSAPRFYFRPIAQSSSHPASASGLHRQGFPGSPQPLCPIALNVCDSHTHPLPPQAGQGLVRAVRSFALGGAGFWIMAPSITRN